MVAAPSPVTVHSTTSSHPGHTSHELITLNSFSCAVPATAQKIIIFYAIRFYSPDLKIDDATRGTKKAASNIM